MWTMNFQMFKLVLEKSEEPEIKLLLIIQTSKHPLDNQKAREFQKYIYSAILTAKTFYCVNNSNLENS